MQYLFGSVLATVVTVLFSLAIAAILRSVLGGQPARWRSFFVALLTVITVAEVATPVAQAMGWKTDGTGLSGTDVLWWVVMMALVTAGAAVGALGVLVVWEAVIPTGRFGTFTDIGRSIISWVIRSIRYLSLGWIAITSGLWRVASRGPDSPAFGDALVETLGRAGPTFVKAGQVLSTRTELVNPQLAESLSRLQSDVPPVSSEAIVKELTSAWGKNPHAVLASFDPQPMAAASLAQVHAATLRDGSAVVVKVRRPGAVPQVRVDCSILQRFAINAAQRWEWARRFGIVALADGLVGSLLGELDYRAEARNMRVCAAVLSDDPLILTPRVVDELSSESVLVMQRLNGRKLIDAVEDIPESLRPRMAKQLLARVVRSIFDDGVFHADLHPGNILLLDDGRIGLLDFGAIGVIDQETRTSLATLLAAILSGDNLAATTALSLAFDVDRRDAMVAMQRDLGRLMTLHLTGPTDLTALVGDLMRFLGAYGIVVPGDVAGAFRTLTSLQGTLDVMDPHLDYLAELKHLMPGLVARSLDPVRLAQQAAVESAIALSIARRLPERVDRITDDLAHGRLVIRTRAFADSDDRRWSSGVVSDAVSGILAAVLLAVGAILFTAAGGPLIGPEVSLYQFLGAVAGVSGAALSFRLLVRVFRR